MQLFINIKFIFRTNKIDFVLCILLLNMFTIKYYISYLFNFYFSLINFEMLWTLTESESFQRNFKNKNLLCWSARKKYELCKLSTWLGNIFDPYIFYSVARIELKWRTCNLQWYDFCRLKSVPGAVIHSRFSTQYGISALPQWSVYGQIIMFKICVYTIIMFKNVYTITTF